MADTKYIPISKLPRLLQRDITAVVNEKPTKLELMKEEFQKKMWREKERKIIERYELKQRRVMERVPRVIPPSTIRKTYKPSIIKPTGVNIKKPLPIIKQEPVRKFLREGERKSMAEIQAHYRRPFKINAPRKSIVPNIEKRLMKPSALPPITQKHGGMKNNQNNGREMSPHNIHQLKSYSAPSRQKPKLSSEGSSSSEEVREFKNDSETDDERQIVGISEVELEGLQDFYKWKIEQMRMKEEQLYEKALKAKGMSGESVDGLKEGVEERLLLKQWEVLYELAERQQEQDRMEEQRIGKAYVEADELKRAPIKIDNREQEKIAKREGKKEAQEKRAREERQRRARAQQEADEEEKSQLQHFISHSPILEGYYPNTRRMSNRSSEKGGDLKRILIKQEELLAELAERQRDLEILQEQRLEKERQEAEESEERTSKAVTTPEMRTPRSFTHVEMRNPRPLITAEKKASRAQRSLSPPTKNFEEAEQIDGPDVALYIQAAEDATQTDSQPFSLKECRICGRRFAEERLPKHEKCCTTANKKRKQFDPVRKRWQGTDALLYQRKADKKVVPRKRKIDFRKQREEFKKTVEYAKKVKEVEKNGGDIRQITPPPPTVNPDYVQCPHCERRFNSTAAERHIPRCVDIKGRPLRKR